MGGSDHSQRSQSEQAFPNTAGKPDGRDWNLLTAAQVARLESALGLEFQDRARVQEAFVHRSFVNELADGEPPLQDNERLEFLGDSALGLVVSDIVFHRFPHYAEGELTRVRSLIVRRETLAELARDLSLGEYLQLGRGEDESGGRERPAILCATFEAVMGAVYLEHGLAGVEHIMRPMLDNLLGRWKRDSGYKDAKSRLQEWSQEHYGVAPRYKVIEQSGPDHARRFVIQVTLLHQRLGVGMGMSKQEASQAAAHMALVRVGEAAESESHDMRTLAATWSVPEDGRRALEDARENHKGDTG